MAEETLESQIEELRVTTTTVPQFKIRTGPLQTGTTFEWEFVGEERSVGRFRRQIRL